MNRKQIVGATVIAAVAFAAGLVMRSDRTATAAGPDRPQTVEPPLATPKPPVSKSEAIADLTTILRETESVDTFLLTLQTLARQNSLDKTLVPMAIRKAEKLGLIDGALFNPKPQQQVFLQVLNQLQGAGPIGGPGCPPGCAPAVAYGYGYEAPACPPGCAPVLVPSYGPPPEPSPPVRPVGDSPPLAVPTPATPER